MKWILLLMNLMAYVYVLSQPCSRTNGTNCHCPDGKDTCYLLPDIKISGWAMQNHLNGPSEYGPTRHGNNNGRIRITGSTPNIGSGPIHIKPTQLWICDADTFNFYPIVCSGGDLPKQLIKQIVYKKEGNNIVQSERLAGSMSYHPTHMHVHVDDWTIFTLRKQNHLEPDTLKWPIVGDGVKISYCLMDYGTCSYYNNHCRDDKDNPMLNPDFPNYGMGGGNFTCSPIEQGISVGYTDLYEEFLDGMWIDLPKGLCNGDYWIVAEVDPWNYMLEENDNNNFAAIPIKLKKQISLDANVELTADKPVINKSVEILNNEKITLSPVAYGNSYLWSTGDTTFAIEVNDTGSYSVMIESLCGFVYSDTINVKKLFVAAPQVAADTVCVNNPVTLSASSSVLEQIVWFDANGTPLDTGDVFVSDPLSVSTSFYAEAQKTTSVLLNVGAKDTSLGPADYNLIYLSGLNFDVHQPIVIKSVVIYAKTTGNHSIFIEDENNNSKFHKYIQTQPGYNRITLNAILQPGKNYTFSYFGTSLISNSNGADFPYSLPGIIDITGTPYVQGYYFFFYDWEIEIQ